MRKNSFLNTASAVTANNKRIKKPSLMKKLLNYLILLILFINFWLFLYILQINYNIEVFQLYERNGMFNYKTVLREVIKIKISKVNMLMCVLPSVLATKAFTTKENCSYLLLVSWLLMAINFMFQSFLNLLELITKNEYFHNNYKKQILLFIKNVLIIVGVNIIIQFSYCNWKKIKFIEKERMKYNYLLDKVK